MSVKANNLTEIAGLKAGQRVIQVDGKWVAVGVGCKPGGGESEPTDLSFITATADKILTGFTGADQQGNEVPGTMPVSTVTETSEKVTVTKGYLGENKEFAVSSGGGTDTSDANVKDTDMVIGAIAYGENGKVYGSRKYVEDATVYFSDGNLCTSEPVYLDPNNPVTMYSFDGNADPSDIADGKTAYVGGGKATGIMPHIGVGHMIINEGGTLDIPVKGYFEYDSIDMKTIPGIGDLAPENIAYGKTICGITGTFGGSIPGTSGDYVLPDDYKEDIQIAFWKNYKVVQTVKLLFQSGDSNQRVWESPDSWKLYYDLGKWNIAWYNDQLILWYSQATNERLRRHNWTIVDPPVTSDKNIEFDFISLEDYNWTHDKFIIVT
jgi:hypothetical protein